MARGHEETLDRVLVSFVDVTGTRRSEEEVRRLKRLLAEESPAGQTG